MKAINLANKSLRNLDPYKPLPTIEQISKEVNIPVDKILKLDSGENIYVSKLISKKIFSEIDLSKYPDPECIELRKRLSDYTGFPPEWIVCGNGSDELIDLITKIFISSGDEAIVNLPTFAMYEFYPKLYGGKVIKVQRRENFEIDLKRIKSKVSRSTKLIFVDSPGNPTSKITELKAIKALLSLGKIVVVDEAYFEYAGKTALPLLKKYENLIILRTLSKWAGMAGLRVGYLLANPEIINLIFSVKSPYNVNSAAQKVGCWVLDNRKRILKEVKRLSSFRDRLVKTLSTIPQLKVYPSDGAYVLFSPKGSAKALQDYLKAKGYLVKRLDQPPLDNTFRMNLIGTKETKLVMELIQQSAGVI